ncbi:PhoH family protein [Marinomonas rhizomae]|uniref:PhoH-like protein n=1 Tax=Marinomonas rhizomae TaxID=491948 RepID=A0A366JAX6_9GAMM|nr:PhoH family protein [Marinomonas rhizomae]RBP84113.1 phosphate starvation-inducible PhoH-like protein [Marinomonas rhizomae]RNF74446.1 PhoH family protein [Marinomonas rhizomae]
METTQTTQQIRLVPAEADALVGLCGQLDENIKLIEKRLDVSIKYRAELFDISGENSEHVAATKTLLENLYREALANTEISPETIHLYLQESAIESLTSSKKEKSDQLVIKTRKAFIKPKGKNQQGYVKQIRKHDINFGIGPAGTGKTYLAVACAVEALEADRVERIMLVRPAVEAGEKLGFLPGDLSQKIDPYLRPLYDALYEMLGFELVDKLIEKNVIEIAPLAFMRGRTLNNAFIILDESQNTTKEQMKMFLTRIGFGSTAVITGDTTQVDLPRGTSSGLAQAMHVLNDVNGISMTHFSSADVVRHPLVQRIVEAYDKFDIEVEEEKKARTEARLIAHAEQSAGSK